MSRLTCIALCMIVILLALMPDWTAPAEATPHSQQPTPTPISDEA